MVYHWYIKWYIRLLMSLIITLKKIVKYIFKCFVFIFKMFLQIFIAVVWLTKSLGKMLLLLIILILIIIIILKDRWDVSHILLWIVIYSPQTSSEHFLHWQIQWLRHSHQMWPDTMCENEKNKETLKFTLNNVQMQWRDWLNMLSIFVHRTNRNVLVKNNICQCYIKDYNNTKITMNSNPTDIMKCWNDQKIWLSEDYLELVKFVVSSLIPI